MYLAVPIIIYACERLTRALRSSIKPVKIQKVYIYIYIDRYMHCSNIIISGIDGIVFYVGRWPFIREMSWHFTCQSHKDSNTKVGSTCLSTVLQFHLSNGKKTKKQD